MISPDLAETVKRLRELFPEATPGDWIAEMYVGRDEDGGHDEGYSGNFYVQTDAEFVRYVDLSAPPNAKYIAAANPAAISSILDALEGLERDNASLRQKLAMIEAGYSPDAPKDMADVDRRLANLKHV